MIPILLLAASVIPNPASITPAQGQFALASATVIVVPAGDAEAERTAQRLRTLLGSKAPVVAGEPRDNAINLVRGGAAGEGYRVDVSPRRVTIAAKDGAGLFHGSTTVSQLVAGNGIPAQAIE